MLSRAGWVGTWRHGAALWSGDIGSTMAVLKSQTNFGISAQTSGIRWWKTDIGGYHGGQPANLQYEEPVAHWFQYGFTCPMLRQHGERSHTCPWFYGNKSEACDEAILLSAAGSSQQDGATLQSSFDVGVSKRSTHLGAG